jgi:hypothetical protein
MHFVDVESYSFVLKDITREFLKGGWVQSYLRIALSRRVKYIIVNGTCFCSDTIYTPYSLYQFGRVPRRCVVVYNYVVPKT